MIILGLTGSIGMGKSTTARMFAEAGIPVHDSDKTVHRLYRGEAVVPVGNAFPGVVVDGVIDRTLLSKQVLGDPAALKRLEAIVHPLVKHETDAFLRRHRARGLPLVVLDIPLLFETGDRERVDKVAVVTAAPEIQRDRVLARPSMTEEKFASILARQVPDDEKRALADFIIDTGKGMESARDAVETIILELTGGKPAAPLA